METRSNGSRFTDYYKWEQTHRSAYDYAKHGLLRHIMSKQIVDTNNNVLKFILNYIETSMIFVMKYTDVLKNFKNIHWKNR